MVRFNFDYLNDNTQQTIDAINAKVRGENKKAEPLTEKPLTLKEEQAILNEEGYYKHQSLKNIDGKVGKHTKEALEEYQKEHGLEVNGQFNEATIHALQKTAHQFKDLGIEVPQPKEMQHAEPRPDATPHNSAVGKSGRAATD